MGERRDRMGTFFFRIFGPATVEGALHGSGPEAREAWKRHVESRRLAGARERAERDAARRTQRGTQGD